MALIGGYRLQSLHHRHGNCQPPQHLHQVSSRIPRKKPTRSDRRNLHALYTASVSLTFKSLKPPAAFTISVQPTDTISSIKAQLASQPSAPPADAQRLLLKGKALADGKLLQEYTVKDGDTINLVIKPGFDWDPSKVAPTSSSSSSSPPMSEGNKPSSSLSSGPRRGHQRIPSVVLSPSPSNETPGLVEKDILLTLDSSTIPGSVQTEALSAFGVTVAQPEFWERLYAFLKYVSYPNIQFLSIHAHQIWRGYK